MNRRRPSPPERQHHRDTICAQATPPGTSGLAVIRVSGPDTLHILDQLFRGPRPSRQASHTVRLGWLTDRRGRTIDQVMVTVFRQPKSYTGEELAELTCHGGLLVPATIIRALQDCGCRPAHPGEFSRRAVLAGKMTLRQAEAVRHLIAARTRAAAGDALARYHGEKKAFGTVLRRRLEDLLAELEFHLGIDESDRPNGTLVAARIRPILRDVERTIVRVERTRLLHEGARVAIVGRPNVGKSSLFNCLLEQDRSIVARIPGTTRDRVSEWTVFGRVPALLTDTAGLGTSSKTEINRRAAGQTQQAIEQSDLLLVVLDGSEPLRRADLALIQTTGHHPRIFVVNKTDRPQHPDGSRHRVGSAMRVSCRTGAGVSRLRLGLGRRLLPRTAEGIAAGEHELEALRSCRDALRRALDSADAEIAALEIRAALDMLSQVDMPIPSDAILDRVFRRFCVGK